jgi:hypothetical protein
MKRFTCRRKPEAVLTILLGLLLIGSAHATSVRQVSVEQMLAGSDFLFEGRVVSQQARALGPAGGKGIIYTDVTFEVLDVIKGEYPGDTVTLSFMGGSLEGVRMHVSEMRLPQMGEKGIYFVESMKRHQVHPLYGWDQGHYLVEPRAGGGETVKTRAGKPVYGVKRGTGSAGGVRLSKGVADGMRLSPATDEAPMSATQFKTKLRDMLAGGGQ